MRSYQDFKTRVLKVNEKYNQNYLSAEYDTAIASAQAAGRWNTYLSEADVYPNLKYVTIGDNHVRDDHAALNGTIKPINDPFWRTWYPPNGFRCRCTVEQTKEPATLHTPNEQIDYRFAHNSGADQEVFTVMHPYFSMPDKDLSRLKDDAERFKVYAGYHKLKDSKVEVSPFADRKDLSENIKAGNAIADIGYEVRIRPHINHDGVKNPEFLIDNELGDLKSISSLKNGIENALRSSKAQRCVYTVIKPSDFNDVVICRKLDGILAMKRYSNQKIIFIKGDKAQLITWEDVEKGNHKDLLKKYRNNLNINQDHSYG